MTPSIRSTAISSISTTTASTAAAACRAPSTALRAVLPTETVFGVQTRYDDIITALNYTYQRQLLAPYIYRPRQRGQRRHLCREHGALDRLVADHRRLARRLFRGIGQFDAAAGELGKAERGHRQPEIQDGDRAVRQDRIVCRRRHGLSQQRRALHDSNPSARRSDDAGGFVAISGALARRRGRHPHQSHTGSRQLGQSFLPAPGFRTVLRRRHRRHHGGAAQPTHRYRVHQRLPSCNPGSTSMPILRCRAPGSSASIRRKRHSTNRLPAIRRPRSATRRATSSTTRHG